MSFKGSKGGAPPRKDEGANGSLEKRTIPAGLIEISHDCHKQWDSIIAKLKAYCRDNYQDLQSICQDPMKVTVASAYRKHLPPMAELEAIRKENDPSGYKNKIFMGLLSGRNNQYLKFLTQQRINKENCYTVIREMCSAQLNSLLAVDAAFIACEEDDSLELLRVIKRLVTARPDGNEELDRQKTLSE